MDIDEAISELQHAARFKPVALLACCAAETTRFKEPRELEIAFRIIAALATVGADELHHSVELPAKPLPL